MMRNYLIYVLGIFLFAGCGELEQSVERELDKLSGEWQYTENSIRDINSIPDSVEWETVTVPHTWNRFDAVDAVPGYRRDTSWYQKSITVPDIKGRFFIYFEGSNITTSLFVNQQFVGTHIGGYVGFEMDVTDYLRKGENNIMVRVDNSYDPSIIPSQKSDFFIYGGMIRDVWLKQLPETHISDIQISTPRVTHDSATTHCDVEVSRGGVETKSLKAKIQLFFEGEEICSSEELIEGERGIIEMPVVDQPELWSPDQPNLYTARVTLYKDNVVADQKDVDFGYRWYRFDEHGAFYLNGERLLIRGTHRHEEHAGYGGALPDSIHWNDMKLIKEMGGNFVRLGHYPQDPEVYKACNELGLIVWDELPWCRGGMGGEKWKNVTEHLLVEMIDQNYNHPSIFFWSLGNEIYWVPDFEGGGNKDSINKFLTHLHDLAHQKDPYRLTAMRKYYSGAHIVDVFSPSIWSGWYAGVYKSYEDALDDARKKYPRFLHMEYGGSSHFGRHEENPITGEGVLPGDAWSESENQMTVRSISSEGNWSESYIVDLFDWHLHITERLDWLPGNAQWALKDFGSPLRAENPIPYMNQKGLTDRSGKPKDAFYVFKSYWSDDPFVYIESHSWNKRYGKKNELKEVCVYSNCDSVELFLNGKSQGMKIRDLNKFPAQGLQWHLPFLAGSNEIKAEGYVNGQATEMDQMSMKYYTDKPQTPWYMDVNVDSIPGNKLLISVQAYDYDSVPCLNASKEVYFSQLSGRGQLIVDHGTPHNSQVIEMADGYAAVEFKPVPGEKAVIGVFVSGTKGNYVTIE